MSALHWFYDLLHLFFPKVCLACGHALFEQEQVVCFSCLYKLPKTGFHLHAENPVSRMFWGRANLHAATSFLFFSKSGSVQQLIHALKYKGHKEAGVYLGKLLGQDLKKSKLFNEVELVVPVPLHSKKQRKRGFNQSECIADGISQGMEIPFVAGNLIREVHTATQTKKTRYKRWDNVKGVFGVLEPAVFEHKHILLVDDVLTTGATLESCTECLLAVPGVRVSVATLACALG